jgi:hypothetical protein
VAPVLGRILVLHLSAESLELSLSSFRKWAWLRDGDPLGFHQSTLLICEDLEERPRRRDCAARTRR